MAVRYYLCNISQRTEAQGGNAPALRDAAVNYAAQYPVDLTLGTCLVVVNSPNQTTAQLTLGSDVLPDYPLDSTIAQMGTVAFLSIKTKLVARNIPVSIDACTTYREILRAIGRHLNPAFDESALMVKESS